MGKSKKNINLNNLSYHHTQINNKKMSEVNTKNKSKKVKDSNAPKRAMSSFMFFSKEVRSIIREENPDATFGDIGKLVGKAFKNLRAEEKEKFEIMANKDRERYKEEKATYDQQKTPDNRG